MAKKKLVSFRVDESMYEQLTDVAAQREMKIGELAREIVHATLSGSPNVAGQPWVKTLEAMIGEVDMRLDDVSDAAELRHEMLENQFKFTEGILMGLLRGVTQSVVLMQKLVHREDPTLLKQALADAETSEARPDAIRLRPLPSRFGFGLSTRLCYKNSAIDLAITRTNFSVNNNSIGFDRAY
jgi:hypothetical protein